jgi:hypothetical protein
MPGKCQRLAREKSGPPGLALVCLSPCLRGGRHQATRRGRVCDTPPRAQAGWDRQGTGKGRGLTMVSH